VQLTFDISEIFSRHYICEDRQFSCGKDGAEGGATEESVRGTPFDKPLLALSEDVARLYCKTSVADIDLPADGIILVKKRAIALGLMAQEPLSVFAGIGVETDVASKLELHPLHYMVLTNGVDVNRALLVPHLQPMMSFLGGLGPRKATELIIKLKQYANDESNEHNYLPSLKNLYANQFMGRVGFLSCAAFLRVRDRSLPPGGSTVEAVRERTERLQRTARSSGCDMAWRAI
jgi:transcriptional accessory protein Tex/SPT6